MFLEILKNSLIIILILLLCLYFYFKFHKNTYWQRRKIECPPVSNVMFGHYGACITGNKNVLDLYFDFYNTINGAFGGFYLCGKPIIFLKCPNLIKKICVDDFDIFADRFTLDNNDLPSQLYGSLPLLKGEQWRQLRNALQESFSDFKVNNMISTIAFLGLRFQESLGKSVDSGINVVNGFSFMSQFLSDVICTTQFGIDIDDNCPDSIFGDFMEVVFDPDRFRMIKGIAIFVMPKTCKFFNIGQMKNVEDKIKRVSESIIHQREINKIYRNDLVQALIELRNTGKVSNDTNTHICEGSIITND